MLADHPHLDRAERLAERQVRPDHPQPRLSRREFENHRATMTMSRQIDDRGRFDFDM
jgi:hypothetical protein